MVEESHGPLARTYRPTWSPLRIVWVVLGIVAVVLLVLSAVRGQWLLAASQGLLGLTAAFSVWGLGVTGEATVAPEGLRVRVGFGWRQLTWDEIATIDRPKRLGWLTRGLWVKTRSGRVLEVSVPSDLRDELMAYAETHKSKPAA